MPTDENNGVNPQNQQVNFNQQVDPNLAGNQFVQNSGPSDDFDFNFDDSNTDQNMNGLSGDMQNQMRKQGRSGMFLTPDEAINKSVDDNNMSFGQIDISSTVQPQKRSGMFLTPDEEAQKEETQVEGNTYSFQGGSDNPTDNTEDSYLAGIDPNDVDDQGDTQNDSVAKVEEDSTPEALDSEIEDLISFDNEPSQDQVESSVQDSQNNVPETVVQNEAVTNGQNVGETLQVHSDDIVQGNENVQISQENSVESNNENIQNNQNIQQVDNVVAEPVSSVDENKEAANQIPGNSDDWLSQEDKKVEETFGVESESVPENIDMSPEDVSKNVENVINEPQQEQVSDVAQNLAGEDNNESILQNNDLHIENMGTDVVENGNGDLISDTGGLGQVNQQTNYVPNENDFSKMSDLLNSSSTGPVDLSNIESNQSENAGNLNLENNVNIQSQKSVLESSVDAELGKFEGVQPIQVEPALQVPQVPQVTEPLNVSTASNEPSITVNETNNAMTETSAEIDLDSLVVPNTNDGQNAAQSNSVTNGSLIGAVNSGTEVGASTVQPAQAQAKKHKKQSGFKVMGIFLGVCVALGGLIYAASVMFPEEFSKIFKKNDIVSEIIWGDTATQTDVQENNSIDELDGNNIENPENLEEDGNTSMEVEEPDPDSLAALLSGNDENTENLESSEALGSGEDNIIEEATGGDSLEVASSGDNVGNNENEEFDPFSDINDVIGSTQEDKEKLENYVTQGQNYLDWGTTNSKPVVAKYGEYIVNTAQEQLTKLEKGEEIDTTLFDRFDEILVKLSDLAK